MTAEYLSSDELPGLVTYEARQELFEEATKVNKFQKRVLKLEYPNYEGAHILISCPQRRKDEPLDSSNIGGAISFLFDDGNGHAVEWSPTVCGPVRRWTECDEYHHNAKVHYYFDFVIDDPLAISQLAVDNLGLPKAAKTGNFEHIFAALEGWLCC